jgi:hypothetical protein
MTDDPQRERIARLLAELGDLPFEEREAFMAALSEEDREALWAAELERSDEVLPEDYEELGEGE